MELISTNKKAHFDYHVVDDVEAGLVLLGTEIKAVRAHKVTITGSYIRPFVADNGPTELWWVGSHFAVSEGDQDRTKKILLHRSEIEKIIGKLSSKGYTLIPLSLYLSRGKAKLKIGLGERKKKQDKRASLREQDIQRDVAREFRNRQKSDQKG